jgi:uncharacterized protein YhfF
MTLAEARARYPGAETFTFGDSQELCEELLALVRQGKKVATCGALADFAAGDEAMPMVGRRDISLEWDGTPALVIETREVVICRFDEVDERMALLEGENDDLAGWQADHRRYFERNGVWSPDMMLVWERFALIEDCAEGEA